MRFRDWIYENNFQLIHQGSGKWGDGNKYQIRVLDDEFLHFTTADRAEEIIHSGHLLMKPPYPKFGTDTVDAISLTFGRYVPGTQLDHISSTQPIVAIRFKTNLPPAEGFIEEVKWHEDVPLLSPSIVPQATAIQLLSNSKVPLGDQDNIIYLP